MSALAPLLRPRRRCTHRAAARASIAIALSAWLLAGPLSVSAQAAANATPAAAPVNAPVTAPVTAPTPTTPPATTAPMAALPPVPQRLTVALVLPSQATPFARAAETVRQGFFAAHAAGAQDVAIQVIEIDERPEQVLRAMSAARERGAQVLVGPLTRAQVNAAVRTDAGLPVITLSLPDSDVLAAPTLLAFGLSVEQEARAVVRAALDAHAPPPGAPTRLTPRFVLLAGDSPLARRASAAFQAALREAGERVVVLPVTQRYDTLQALGDKVFRAEPEAVFLALDAREAAVVRPRLSHQMALYATSLVNLGGAEGALLAPELEGVRFVDAPWLLEPDHPAVMVFARPATPLSAELNRLYALGIDAYRLALEWASGRQAFALDGVTGSLRVDRAGSARVERTPSFAVFRQGAVARATVPAATR